SISVPIAPDNLYILPNLSYLGLPTGRGFVAPKPRNCGLSGDWKSATVSLSPACLSLRALPSLCSGNPFRPLPDGSSQQVGNLRYVQGRWPGKNARLRGGLWVAGRIAGAKLNA